MTIEDIWATHRAGAPREALDPVAATGEEWFYLAMLAYQAAPPATAAALAERAGQLEPGHAVYREAARYLRAGRTADVYSGPAAFTAFATGGGNVGLYRAAHAALRGVYARHRPARLLDIGTGEGHGLLPALTDDVGHVDLLEPSRERLALVTGELTRRGVPHRAHPVTAQELMRRGEDGPWDLVQETFALLAVDRSDRLRLLRWLRPRARRLALVEFDVPDLGGGLHPRWFRYVVSRYRRGIGEYAGAERELVAQGFLIPVLLGVLGGGDDQRHHEQPIARWVADLADAGFHPEAPRHLHDYWWAPAYLLEAA